MATGLLQINYTAFPPDFGINLNIPNPSAPIKRDPAYPFATGNQGLTAPAGSMYLLVQNVVNGPLTLVGNVADVGYDITSTMSTTNPPLLSFPASGILQFNAPADCKADLTYL